MFVVLGASIASLEEITETARFVRRREPLPGTRPHQRNLVLQVGSSNLQILFQARRSGHQEITIPKLNEMTCEQEVAGVPYVSFVANDAKGETVNNSFVLRGYVPPLAEPSLGELYRFWSHRSQKRTSARSPLAASQHENSMRGSW